MAYVLAYEDFHALLKFQDEEGLANFDSFEYALQEGDATYKIHALNELQSALKEFQSLDLKFVAHKLVIILLLKDFLFFVYIEVFENIQNVFFGYDQLVLI